MSFTKPAEPQSPLAHYRLLGKSGLRVSPICLGAMTFGENWGDFGMKMTYDEVEKVCNSYFDKGGNFIDTANFYQWGQSEEWLGNWMQKRQNRDQIVLASKYTLHTPFSIQNPNFCGNQRKNMFQAIENSLKRLNTHYLDVFYLHLWDYTTPAKEVVRAFDDLVRSGKVHYIAVSDTPAWEVSRMNMMAELQGWSEFIAYQGRYHLGDRAQERDVLPMCRQLGLGGVPWGVLGQGKWTGRFKSRDASGSVEGSRKGLEMSDNDWLIAEELGKVAEETKRSIPQVALNWALDRPGNTSLLLGVSSAKQLEDSIKCLDFSLTQEQLKRLNDVSKIDLGFPHDATGNSPQNCPWIQHAGKIVPNKHPLDHH